MHRRMLIAFVLGCVALAFSVTAQQNQIVVYSPFNDDFMQALSRPFTAATGIRVANIVISTGESQSRLRAERARPQADFWLSVRPAILQAAFDEGLIQAYDPAGAANIQPSYRYPETHITAVGTYPLVFFYNSSALQRLRIPAPTADWQSLLRSEYRGQIVMPHPATSGTAYAAITTMLQRFMQQGRPEDTGWVYVRELAQNIAQFTRSGRAPQALVAAGEYPIGIGFYDAVWQLQQEGFPVEVVVPNPVFAEPYGAAIVADAPNLANARRYFDYLLTPEAQRVLTQFGNYPVIAGVPPPQGGVEVPPGQVIAIDFRWSAQNQARILERFQVETRADPR